MRTLVIGALLALPACAGFGGGVPPSAWTVSAEPLAEGLLVKWNIPDAEGRTISLDVIDDVTQERVGQAPLVAADLHARLVTDLPAGDWVAKIVVTEKGAPPKTLKAYKVTLDASLAPVRSVGLADLGLASDLATPVLVAVPAWRASDPASLAVRESLEFVAADAARAAFGRAYFVESDADVTLLRDVRKELLVDRAVSDLPLALDARALVVVDLRPGMGDDPATLTLRLFDITLIKKYDDWATRPWNRYALVFEDFVAIEGLRHEAGVSHSRALLAGFRELYRALASDRHVQAYLEAVSGGLEVFEGRQAPVLDAVEWMAHLDDMTGSDGRRVDDNVQLVEREVLFMRDAAPLAETVEPIEDASPDDTEEPIEASEAGEPGEPELPDERGDDSALDVEGPSEGAATSQEASEGGDR